MRKQQNRISYFVGKKEKKGGRGKAPRQEEEEDHPLGSEGEGAAHTKSAPGSRDSTLLEGESLAGSLDQFRKSYGRRNRAGRWSGLPRPVIRRRIPDRGKGHHLLFRGRHMNE